MIPYIFIWERGPGSMAPCPLSHTLTPNPMMGVVKKFEVRGPPLPLRNASLQGIFLFILPVIYLLNGKKVRHVKASLAIPDKIHAERLK
ncbi:MAG: hypothetical protein WHT07_03580 [Desulfobaccales bacterium]